MTSTAPDRHGDGARTYARTAAAGPPFRHDKHNTRCRSPGRRRVGQVVTVLMSFSRVHFGRCRRSRLIRRGLGGEFESLSNTHRTTMDGRYVHGVVLHTFPYFHTHKRNLYFAIRTLYSGYDVYMFIYSSFSKLMFLARRFLLRELFSRNGRKASRQMICRCSDLGTRMFGIGRRFS